MSKQIIVRLYKGGLNGELVANSQIITLEGLGSNPVSGRDFTDGKLTGTVTTGGQFGVFYKRLAKPFWSVAALNETVKASQSFTFNWTVNIPYTENTLKWYVVDPSTDLPYSGLGISSATKSGTIVPSGSGQTGSFIVNTTPISTIQNFQVAIFNGDIGTSTLLARSNTCFIDPVIFTVTPPSPREVRYGTTVNFTVAGYANEEVTWTGANTGVGITNSSGLYLGTFGNTLPPGVNTIYFNGNITQTEVIYTVNVFTDVRLEVTGIESAPAGTVVNWTIKSEPNQKVYWKGIHDINDSGDITMSGSGTAVRNFGKSVIKTYTWEFTGDGVPNKVTKQLQVSAPSGLGLNYQPEYFYGSPVTVSITGATSDAVTWTYVSGSLQEPAYFDYFPEAAEEYNNTAGEIIVPTTIQGVRDSITADQFAQEVQVWYQQYLKRYADQNGLDYWVNQLVNDRTRGLSEIRLIVENGIKTSSEAIEVASSGSRKPPLTKQQFAIEHYKNNPAGRFSPEDAVKRETSFPIVGNIITLSAGTVGTATAILTQINMIPRSSPYRFKFTGVLSAPPQTADIVIKRTYGLVVTPDIYMSGSTVLSNALVILTVTGAPGEYVRVWNASDPSFLIHTWTTRSGRYSFNLLQYANALANGIHTFVFDGDKTPNQPTYTLTISASAGLAASSPTNIYFEGRPLQVNFNGAKNEEIGWTYTPPSRLNTKGLAYFDYYESVARAYIANREGLTEDQYAQAHYNKWNSRIQTLMSPEQTLSAVNSIPSRAGKFTTMTNSLGVLSAELNTDLTLKARTTPYEYVFDGNISSGTPSLLFTIRPANSLTVEAPIKGYVGQDIPVNVLGAPNDTVTVIRGTQSDIKIPLNSNGRSETGFNIAKDATFTAGSVVRFEFRGQLTPEEVYKDITIEASTVSATGGTSGITAAIRLIRFVDLAPAGGILPEYSNDISRWRSTTYQFQLYWQWENAYDIAVRASPGFAYSDRQSFEVQGPITNTNPGTALHTPGKPMTYRLFARGQVLTTTLNTGQINTSNKSGLYNPGYEDRTAFVSTQYELNRGSEHYFINFDRYVLWRTNTTNVYPTKTDIYRYVTMKVYYSASATLADFGYNITIYDAYTNVVTDEIQTFFDFGNWSSKTSVSAANAFDQVYLYAKPTTTYTPGPFTANIVVREGSALGSGAIIGWQLVTLMDPVEAPIPIGTGSGVATVTTDDLELEVVTTNVGQAGHIINDNLYVKITAPIGTVIRISGGYGESLPLINTITMDQPTKQVLIANLWSSGPYSVVVETTDKKVARVSVNVANPQQG